jgi:RNA polymerase sigma factor (sigma-70 family)
MTDEEILKLICASDTDKRRALEHLYRYRCPEFRRYFQSCRIDLNECEDLIQEFVIKLFKNAGNFKNSSQHSKDSANAWMWSIVRNCANDYFRLNKTKNKTYAYDEERNDKDSAIDQNNNFYSEDPLAESENNSENLLNSNPHLEHLKIAQIKTIVERQNEIEIDECVSNGIEQFNAYEPDRAKVLILKMDGFSIEYIAKEIDRTTSATKEYLSQCRKKLEPYIKNCIQLINT